MTRILPLIAACLLLNTIASDAIAEAPQAVRHRVLVELDPESRELVVEDRFTVSAENAIALDVAPWLTVSEARIDGRTVPANRQGRRVTLPNATAGPRDVEVVLRGLVPALPAPDARATSRGAVAGVEGVYLPGYSAWLPDTGDGWVEYDLAVQVPLPYRAVATGKLVDEQADSRVYRASFATVKPTESPSIFAGPYEIAERREGGLRIRTYFHEELAPLADGYLEVSAAYIRRYAKLIGDYPYADFHIVSAPLPVGLGFPNLTYVGRTVLPLPFMRGRSLAHEILHNWWGNGVAVDYGTGNWAEGLTTYLADYALAAERGEEAARTMRLGWLQNITALPPERDLPVERFVAKQHDAAQVIGYDKVAFVFHMLEAELGPAAFSAGLQRFWKDHRFGVAGWPDLQAAFEAAAGRNLAWFFDQWLERPGAPRIELVDAKAADAEGSGRVRLQVRQSAPAYRLEVPVVVETAGGPKSFGIALEQAERTFDLAAGGKPLAVHIDPDFNVLRRLVPGESPPIFRDITLSGETRVVVRTDDEEMAETARRLAGRLLQREAELYRGDPQELGKGPVLAIGDTEAISMLYEAAGPFNDAAEADGIGRSGTARAWAGRRTGGGPWFFVAADSAEALRDVVRPLPHYRSQSYVVFNGSKAVKRGLWRNSGSPLSRRFEN